MNARTQKTKIIMAVLVLAVCTALFILVVKSIQKIQVIERTDPGSEIIEPQPIIPEQVEPIGGSQGGRAGVPTPPELKATNEAKPQPATSETPEQYPPGYDYTCPAGSYPIGDGECNQQPRDCQDAMQSEKCGV